ncbi:MAG: chemotaxis protein CheB [Myxococcota bacterium]
MNDAPPLPYDLLVVGASAGGVGAVSTLLAGLGPGFPAAVAVVLHIAENRRSFLDRALAGTLRVREAADKQPLVAGEVVVAPPGYHLLVEDRTSYALSTEAPVHFCRPAVDPLFETAADVFGPRLAAALLTGANDDGAAGLRTVEAAGGLVVVQDPDTAEASMMPRAGIAACHRPHVAPLPALAAILTGRAP